MNFEAVAFRQPFQRGKAQLSLPARFNLLIVLVTHARLLRESLLTDSIDRPQLLEAGQQALECWTVQRRESSTFRLAQNTPPSVVYGHTSFPRMAAASTGGKLVGSQSTRKQL